MTRTRSPIHRQRVRISETIKAIHKTDSRLAQWRNGVGKKIRWHTHVRVTDNDHVVSGPPLQLNQRRNLGVGAGRFAANHQLGVTSRIHGNQPDRKSTRLNSSHSQISYAVFCLKKKKAVVLPASV